MSDLMSNLYPFLTPVALAIGIVLLIVLNRYVFQRFFTSFSNRFIIQRSLTLLLIFAGLIAFILLLPIKETLQGQILSVLAIIISAGIALSSTTVLGNIMAGIMNNSMRRFRLGDLIEIGELQGRLVRKSPFHIEIQTEDSNFITIPNLHVATHPIKLTRRSDTVISSTVSLGYDISRERIEEYLLSAAKQAELKNPYVFITNLGDHSVTYKVHGFLADSDSYFSSLSQLNGAVMDALHSGGIEIVSPTFMNQRVLQEKEFIPKERGNSKKSDSVAPEDKIFDEAMESGAIEEQRIALEKLEEQLKEWKKSDQDNPKRGENLKRQMEELEHRIESAEKEQEEKKD